MKKIKDRTVNETTTSKNIHEGIGTKICHFERFGGVSRFQKNSNASVDNITYQKLLYGKMH